MLDRTNFWQLMTCPTIAQHKPIGGCYTSSDKGYNAFGRDYLCFTGNSFVLLRITDTEDEFGSGRFTLTADSLHLIFSGSADRDITVDKHADRNADSVYLVIRVTDKGTHLPIPGVNAVLRRQRIGESTNEAGKASLRISRNQVSTADTLQISTVGYRTRYIPLDLDHSHNQTINITLESGYQYLYQGHERHYAITRNEKRFYTRSQNPVQSFVQVASMKRR